MNAKTQMQFVKDELRKNGEVSRNLALQNYITRLSDIIYKLKKNHGMEIADGKFKKTPHGKDFVYKLTSPRYKFTYEFSRERGVMMETRHVI